VHVWRADLGAVGDDVIDSLCASERERAAHFANARRGLRWARARGVLRALLASYLNVEPATVGFRVGAHGKPALQMPGLPWALSLNMSHSGPLALYAFAAAAAVGVDVQSARARPIDEVAIASRALGTGEGRRLAELEPAERGDEFLRAWTRHEAARKCGGGGIWARRGRGGGRDYVRELSVVELDMGLGAAGAVAFQRDPQELRCWSWGGVSRDGDGDARAV
jgi:4'-phosphopantetheinyl transferase